MVWDGIPFRVLPDHLGLTRHWNLSWYGIPYAFKEAYYLSIYLLHAYVPK